MTTATPDVIEAEVLCSCGLHLLVRAFRTVNGPPDRKKTVASAWAAHARHVKREPLTAEPHIGRLIRGE